MARVRLIGPEAVTVPELGERAVEPDEVVEVPDERYPGYVCQTGTWEGIEEPGVKAAAKKPSVGVAKAAPRKES